MQRIKRRKQLLALRYAMFEKLTFASPRNLVNHQSTSGIMSVVVSVAQLTRSKEQSVLQTIQTIILVASLSKRNEDDTFSSYVQTELSLRSRSEKALSLGYSRLH